MEFALPLTLLLMVLAIAWSFFEMRGLAQRLAALEKQHLVLVEELEKKILTD